MLAVTDDDVAANVVVVAPAATVTLGGTAAIVVLLLVSDTTAPPAGAPELSVTVPVDPVPPVTLDGLIEINDNVATPAAPCGVKRRVDENGPNTPAAFRARTRHHSCWAGRPAASVACDTVTEGFATRGAAIDDESSTWTSYAVAFVTLFQSRSTGCGTFVAWSAGEASVGAEGAGAEGLTVSAAVRVTPPKTAEIVAVVAVVTDVVVTVKFALVAPAGTVTLAGTLVAAEFSDRETTAPPPAAAALRVTVPVEELPPTTLVGLSETAESVGPPPPGGLIVSVPLFVTFSYVAEICTVLVVVTCATFTANVALVWPAGTMTLKGTVARTGLLLTRSTSALPVDEDASVTLPVTVPGPTMVPGVNVTDVGALETERNRFAETVVPAAEALISTKVN